MTPILAETLTEKESIVIGCDTVSTSLSRKGIMLSSFEIFTIKAIN